MRRSTHHKLHQHLQNQVGDALRSLVYYNAKREIVVYLRDDVSNQITAGQAQELIEFLRNRENIVQMRERLGLDTSLRCTVRCWRNHIGLHFQHGPQSGTLVTMDIDIARNLHSFVTECESILE